MAVVFTLLLSAIAELGKITYLCLQWFYKLVPQRVGYATLMVHA